MTDLAGVAVIFANRGDRIFPVNPDKTPRTPRGHLDATTDLSVIAEWMGQGLWDGGGIGLVIPERVFVLDIDPRNGGLETLKAILQAVDLDQPNELLSPRTRTVRTQSGGWHYYYALPEGFDGDLRGKLGPGVDIKKPGRGYVLIPPTPGYTFLNGGRAKPSPQWLLDEIVVGGKRSEGSASAPKFFRGLETGTYRGLAALERVLDGVRNHGEGGRRANLNSAAFFLASFASAGELDEDATLRALLEAALESGLDEEQALKTMRGGWEAGLLQPVGDE